MQYIEIDKDTFIQFNEAKKVSQTVIVPELKQQKAELEKELAAIPSTTDDNVLLDWARENYPAVNYEPKRSFYQGELDIINAILTDLENTELIKKVSAVSEVPVEEIKP